MDRFVCLHVDSIPFAESSINYYLGDERQGLVFAKVEGGDIPVNYKKIQVRVIVERDGGYLTYKDDGQKLNSVSTVTDCYFDTRDEDIGEIFTDIASKSLQKLLKFNYMGSRGLLEYVNERLSDAVIFVSNHPEQDDVVDLCFSIDLSGFTGEFMLIAQNPSVTTQLKMTPFFNITKSNFSEKAIGLLREARDIC